jgi:tetratricopeptide (TPR) repeat protein
MRKSALLLSLALLGACQTLSRSAATKTNQPPQQYLATAEHNAESTPTAASAGRAALATWVITGNAERTETWAQKALALDPGEPQALFARMLMSREALDDRAVAEAALTLLKKSPSSPLAEIAGYRLREVIGQSSTVDRMIESGLAEVATGSMGLDGHAALRVRETLALVRDGRNDETGALRARDAIGTPATWAVVGPLQPLRVRDFNKPSAFDDPKHVLAATYASPLGSVTPRVFQTPEGGLDLDPDPWRADIYEALTDVDAKQGGEYLVALRGASAATVFVDGVPVTQRLPLPTRPADRVWGRVELPAGQHRLRVHFARVDAGWVAVQVARADGSPSDLTFTAPTPGGSVPAATAHALPARSWGAIAAVDRVIASGLSPVDRFLRLQQIVLDDPDAARGELTGLLEAAGESPVVRALRADLTSGDPDMPRADATARITQDLDAILKVNAADARALLGRFQQERNDKRYDEASARMARLVAVVGENQPHILLERARFALERDNAAEARRFANAALQADPDRCEAVAFRVDLARRDGEIQKTDELMPKLLACPGGLNSNVLYLRSRMKVSESVPLLQRMLARNPTSAAAHRALADALFALGDQNGAETALAPISVTWPHETESFKRLAGYRELNGKMEDARDLMHKVAALDGADLTIQRALALDEHREVLGWAARDGLATIAAYKDADFRSDAPAVQVLDLGALEVQPDGSSLERVQSIVQVLNKRGIDQFGEVTIPGDAVPLFVRTIKADGRVLDAELIAGKESISLPNLEPGDFIEYAFVRASPARQAAVPGWAGGQFLFRGDDVPFFESTYSIRAPAALGMEVDSEHIDPPPKVERSGDQLTLTWTNRRADAYLREPMPVPDPEVLPWLEAGSGAGEEAVIGQAADFLPLKARTSNVLTDFVRGTEALPPVQRVQTIVDRIRDRVKGESPSMEFGDSASTVLIRGRGNRMLVLKAALAAAGIPSHFVLARPFNEYPHAYRFPHSGTYHAAILRIEPPGAAPIWMDFSLRLAPLGHIPAPLSGAEAYVIPNSATEIVQRITLPAVSPEDDRTDSTMELTADESGTVTGTIVQRAYGFDAAALRFRLEQINATELRKAQERALSRTFHGLTLTNFAVEDSGKPEDPVVVKSTIKVPDFTNHGGGTRSLAANFGPVYLGPRFVNRAERKTPLLISVDDLSRTHVTLKLPANAQIQVPAPVDLDTPFGRYRSTWKLEQGTLSMDEELLMRRGRIVPTQYPAFKSFAAGVDAAQSREIPLAAR